MLEEMAQTLARLERLGLSSSQATRDLWRLHKRYLPILERIGDCTACPHVMRILAEEAVEGLCCRLASLGIPIANAAEKEAALYWSSYLAATASGEIAGLEYLRFRQAQKLAMPFLEESYEDICQGDDHKTLCYTYALSRQPLPEWFVPEKVLERLEEIITAFGFLWFAVVDYAESRYYEQKGA